MKNNKDIFIELAKLREANTPAALVTVIATKGSTPREPGAKMIVKSDGCIIGTIGGASVEMKSIEAAIKALKDGKTRKITYVLHDGEIVGESGKVDTGMLCGGEMELFIEPLEVPPTFYMFGAGHVGLPTAHIASMCGFRVVVIDPRHEFNNIERFPQASELVIQDFQEASVNLAEDPNGYIVIATPGHGADYEVLRNVLKKSFHYVGLISSRKKRKTLFSKLQEEGFPQDKINFVHSPVGLDIGSETPEEIAVSIVGEMIKVRNNG